MGFVPWGQVLTVLLSPLQAHAFFRHINWDELLARKVEPPFKPLLVCTGNTGREIPCVPLAKLFIKLRNVHFTNWSATDSWYWSYINTGERFTLI